MADEPKAPPASQSLAERIKALTAKAATVGADAKAADAKAAEAKAAEAKAPAAPAVPAPAKAADAKAPAAPAAGSISARIAALAKGAAPDAAPAAPAAAKGAAPAPAAPAAKDDSAPAVGVVGASPLAQEKKLSLSERLKLLAGGKPDAAAAAGATTAPVGAPASARAAPGAAAKASDARPGAAPPPKPAAAATPVPAKPAAAAAKPAAPAKAKPAAAPPAPAKDDTPAWPDFPPNKYSPYVDDAVFELLPKDMQRIILQATNEEGVIPVRRFLRKLDEPDRSAQEELVVGFMENLISTLKTRFFLDDEEPERKMFVEPDGDLSMRTGDGEVKVRAKCWEFFFLFRQRKWLGSSKKDRRKNLLELFSECFSFELGDTSVCKAKVMEPVDFAVKHDSAYVEMSLEMGGWCELRFEAATVFTDGRVLVATFQPRVIRAKDVPPPKAMSPKEFASLLAAKRRR